MILIRNWPFRKLRRGIFQNQGGNALTRLPLIDDWVGEARKARYSSKKLADLCGVSASHLRRFFILHFFRPPQEWINELRLWDAAKLLSEGYSVKEVAAQLHFADASHFAHCFTRYHGLAPSHWTVYWLEHRRKTRDLPSQDAPAPWTAAYQRLLSPLLYNKAKMRAADMFERERHILLAADMT